VDFGAAPQRKGLLAHLHRRHGHVSLPDMVDMLTEAGLRSVESGEMGMRDLQYVLAMAPCCA
jgi:hypothetical protein